MFGRAGSGYVVFLVTILCSSVCGFSLFKIEPAVRSVSIKNETLSSKGKYSAVLVFVGENFPQELELRITNEFSDGGASCSKSIHYGRAKKTWSNESYAEVDWEMRESEFVSDHWFTCVKAVYRTDDVGDFSSTVSTEIIKWVHQGDRGSFVSEMLKKKEALRTGYHSLRLVILIKLF